MPRNSRGTLDSPIDRRTVLKSSAIAGTALTTGLAGCSSVIGGGSNTPTENNPLKIGVYGGVFKDVLDNALVQPFQEDEGVPTTSQPQSVGDAMIKLKQSVDAGEAPVDVLVVAPDARIRGQDLGTWLNYSPDALSNIDSALDRLVSKSDDGQVIGPGAFGWFLNLTSNINVVDEPLTAWRDLWNDKYQNQIAANQLPGDGFLLNIAAHTFDQFNGKQSLQTEAEIKDVMQKVREIKPQIDLWWSQEAQAQQPLKEGNIAATQMYNDVSLVMKENGAPVRTRFPEEGGVLNFGTWTIVKSTSYPDAAKKFVDYSLRPGVQRQITKNLYTAPTIEQSALDVSDQLYRKVYGPGPEEAIQPYITPYLEKEKWLSEQWKQMILN